MKWQFVDDKKIGRVKVGKIRVKKGAQRMNAWQCLQELEEEEEFASGIAAENFPSILVSQKLLHSSSCSPTCACDKVPTVPTVSTIDTGACASIGKASNDIVGDHAKGNGGKGAYTAYRVIATAEESIAANKAISDQSNGDRGRSRVKADCS